MIRAGEIVLCNIVLKGKKTIILKNIIFSRFYNCNFPTITKEKYSYFFNKYKIKEKVLIVKNIEVILKTGFKHKKND